MSEVLGDADPNSTLLDSDVDEDELDDIGDDDLPDLGPGLLTTLGSPLALAITALVLACASLIGFFSTYILSSAFALANAQKDSLFGQRVTTVVELGLASLAAIIAVLAHAAASRNAEDQPQRTTRGMSGAALLLALLSIAQSLAALLIMAGAHLPAATGNG